MTRASLDKQPHEVAAMFDEVAERYDLTNDVLSLGQARLWRRACRAGRRRTRGRAGARPGCRHRVVALPFAAAGAHVVASDFSLGMLRVGKRRRPDLPFVAGDALRLPFADAAFDAVTISFGLRNVSDVDAGLTEMARVTRPGGRLVVCEFSHPTWAPFRTVYIEYLMRALPAVARRVSSNPDAYVYLAESIRAWPDQPALAGRIAAGGWTGVGWRDLSGGIVALHRANRPARSRQVAATSARSAMVGHRGPSPGEPVHHQAYRPGDVPAAVVNVVIPVPNYATGAGGKCAGQGPDSPLSPTVAGGP